MKGYFGDSTTIMEPVKSGFPCEIENITKKSAGDSAKILRSKVDCRAQYTI